MNKRHRSSHHIVCCEYIGHLSADKEVSIAVCLHTAAPLAERTCNLAELQHVCGDEESAALQVEGQTGMGERRRRGGGGGGGVSFKFAEGTPAVQSGVFRQGGCWQGER